MARGASPADLAVALIHFGVIFDQPGTQVAERELKMLASHVRTMQRNGPSDPWAYDYDLAS
jgi:hypothetical protein